MKHVLSVLSVACVAFFTILLSSTSTGCKKGDTGPKGDTGVANAIYSPWTEITFEGAVLQSGDTVTVGTFDAPQITKDVLDKSEIKVYANLGTAAAPNIIPIPYTDFINGFWVNMDMVVGKINLMSNIDGSAPYRYIIVEGTVPSGRRATIDWNDYNAVKKSLNLPD